MADAPIEVWYGGVSQWLTPIIVEGVTKGWHLICPRCVRGMFLNTGMGPHPEHLCIQEPDGRVTVHPYIDCPFPSCRWTGRLFQSVLFDAQRRHAQPRDLP